MKKRKTLASAFTLLFLFSPLACVFVSLGMANPIWVGYYPTEAVKTPPTITFQSPIKYQTYASNSLWLNFSIIKPESWFLQINDGYDEQGNPAVLTLVNITYISYIIDGVTNTSTPVHDLTRYYEAFPIRNLNFSTILTLPDGTHNIAISIQGESYYFMPEQNVNNGPLRTQMNATSEIINFTVRTQETFPTTLVITASGATLAAVSVGLLVYFKKRKR